ncbi:hypothetical protein HDU97_009350 [Phlyctochytrium planicorne]|nr:hypothetical protein HDU97_009350 [Phlyctochytrium planicorne]
MLSRRAMMGDSDGSRMERGRKDFDDVRSSEMISDRDDSGRREWRHREDSDDTRRHMDNDDTHRGEWHMTKDSDDSHRSEGSRDRTRQESDDRLHAVFGKLTRRSDDDSAADSSKHDSHRSESERFVRLKVTVHSQNECYLTRSKGVEACREISEELRGGSSRRECFERNSWVGNKCDLAFEHGASDKKKLLEDKPLTDETTTAKTQSRPQKPLPRATAVMATMSKTKKIFIEASLGAKAEATNTYKKQQHLRNKMHIQSTTTLAILALASVATAFNVPSTYNQITEISSGESTRTEIRHMRESDDSRKIMDSDDSHRGWRSDDDSHRGEWRGMRDSDDTRRGDRDSDDTHRGNREIKDSDDSRRTRDFDDTRHVDHDDSRRMLSRRTIMGDSDDSRMERGRKDFDDVRSSEMIGDRDNLGRGEWRHREDSDDTHRTRNKDSDDYRHTAMSSDDSRRGDSHHRHIDGDDSRLIETRHSDSSDTFHALDFGRLIRRSDDDTRRSNDSTHKSDDSAKQIRLESTVRTRSECHAFRQKGAESCRTVPESRREGRTRTECFELNSRIANECEWAFEHGVNVWDYRLEF